MIKYLKTKWCIVLFLISCLIINAQNVGTPYIINNASTIAALDCAGATVTGTAYVGNSISGVTIKVNYTGGNGGAYSAQNYYSVPGGGSMGGLTATLPAGRFNKGSGSVTLTISGTPSILGTARFPITIGGVSCDIFLPINPNVATVDCANATPNFAEYIIGGAAITTVTVNYTGGNGTSYPAQTVNSYNVFGLTANLAAGTFNNGNGSVTYTISGSPTSGGTAKFDINIGGVTCTFQFSVVQVILITTNTTYTIPPNASSVDVIAIGGGGGGSSQEDVCGDVGGSGGGGGWASTTLTSPLPATLNIVIGAGGAGGVKGNQGSSAISGKNGGNTTVTGTGISLTGGGGGGGIKSTALCGWGTAGTSGTASGGTYNINGGVGYAGNATNVTYQNMGGGIFGTAGFKKPTFSTGLMNPITPTYPATVSYLKKYIDTLTINGAKPPIRFGAGATNVINTAGTSNANGDPGYNYGGGGSTAVTSGSISNINGGAGSKGCVILVLH